MGAMGWLGPRPLWESVGAEGGSVGTMGEGANPSPPIFTPNPPPPPSGQFELGAFVPNMPAAMRQPPPETKEPLSEGEFLAALPAMNTTVVTLGVLWVLRNEPLDMVRGGRPAPGGGGIYP